MTLLQEQYMMQWTNELAPKSHKKAILHHYTKSAKVVELVSDYTLPAKQKQTLSIAYYFVAGFKLELVSVGIESLLGSRGTVAVLS